MLKVKGDCSILATDTRVIKEENCLSNEILSELLQATIKKNKFFRFKAIGFSMCPFIKDGDVITISPLIKEATINLGKVVAFIHSLTKKLVIYRIVGRKGDSYIIKADNIFKLDGLVNLDSILGYVSRVERNGKQVIWGLGPECYIIALLSRTILVFPMLLLLWKYLRCVLYLV
jgi:signal peptidase I